MMKQWKCPCCGADMKDWRSFVATYPELAVADEVKKPFQCVGFRCGKRFDETEILQGESDVSKE